MIRCWRLKLEKKIMIVRDKIRPYHPDDLHPIADVFRAADDALGQNQYFSAEMLQTFIDSPEIDAAKDLFVVERDGRVIGFADCELNSATGHAFGDGVVHPDFWRQGVGTELVRVTEARILEKAAAELVPELPLWVQRNALESSAGEIRLIESQGYSYLRTFYRMRIEFDHPMIAPPLPPGIVLRPFERERDGYTVYQVQQEAFADHWNFEAATYEEWAHFLLDAPNLDFSLWLIAFDESANEIAGICVNNSFGEGDPKMAWTRMLGVRRPWRKQGLGLALLQNSFALFQSRGYVRAGLGVDASSLTNAVALYERAGMHVHERVFAYQKYLRGAAKDFNQA